MKLYWEALRHPTTDRWARWTLTGLYVIAFATNTYMALLGVFLNDRGYAWLLNASASAVVTWIWLTSAREWVDTDRRVRSAPTPFNGRWVCGKCAREVANGFDDGEIPDHHWSCSKFGLS